MNTSQSIVMDNPQTVHCGSTENLICAFLIWTCYIKVFLQLLSMTPHVYIQDDYEEAKETAFVSSDCFERQLVARRRPTTEEGI